VSLLIVIWTRCLQESYETRTLDSKASSRLPDSCEGRAWLITLCFGVIRELPPLPFCNPASVAPR
jgi:hypothetical protein